MSDEIVENKRLGIITPRRVLLPPYLVNNQYFTEFADAIDYVFQSNIDSKIRAIKNLRNMWVSNPAAEQKILDAEMLDLSDWSQPEREILVKQVNMLGMKLKSAGVLTNDNYQIVSRFLGQYWFGKGTQAFIEFINFCLNTNLLIHRMWAEDQGDYQYHNLTVENSDGTPPGTPIWEDGGTWFPTTHIQIEADGGFSNASLSTLTEFLYEIANYNLVLQSVNSTFNLYITDNLGDGHTTANIVAIGIYYDPTVVVSSIGRYGTDSPTVYALNSLPTRVYATASNSIPLLTDPTGWFADTDGKKIPVYSPDQKVEVENSVLPTFTMGNGAGGTDEADASGMILLAAPDDWVEVPGGSVSTALIPVWNSIPSIQTSSDIMTTTIGFRNSFLVNPTDWYEIEPGKYAPYW